MPFEGGGEELRRAGSSHLPSGSRPPSACRQINRDLSSSCPRPGECPIDLLPSSPPSSTQTNSSSLAIDRSIPGTDDGRGASILPFNFQTLNFQTGIAQPIAFRTKLIKYICMQSHHGHDSMIEIVVIEEKPQLVVGMRRRGLQRYCRNDPYTIQICSGTWSQNRRPSLFIYHESSSEEAKRADEAGNAEIEVCVPIAEKILRMAG